MKKTFLIIALSIFSVFTFAANKPKETKVPTKVLAAKSKELNDSINILFKLSCAYNDSLNMENVKYRSIKSPTQEEIDNHKEIYDYYNNKWKEVERMRIDCGNRRNEIVRQLKERGKDANGKQIWKFDEVEAIKGYAASKGIVLF